MPVSAAAAARLVEVLESRTLLSGTVNVSDDTLRVSGDANVPNTITLAETADGDSVVVTINGETQTVSLKGVKKVRVAGSSQRDVIRIDQTNHEFETFCSIETFGGDDYVVCGQEKDYVYLGDGNDTVRLGNGRNKAYGEAGNDHLVGGDDRDLLVCGAGNDQAEGGDQSDEITGDNGNDVLSGGLEDDLIFGGRGNDIINGDDQRDVLVGGTGNDTMNGGADKDERFGNAGDDSLDGGDGRDSIWVGDGDDVILSASKADQDEFPKIDKFLRGISTGLGLGL